MKNNEFYNKKIAMEGLTYDDVLLLPRHSTFKRTEANINSKLHSSIKLNVPVLSSPMDTVTESEMAIAMALNGGLGVIHRNIQIDNQAEMVKKVKQYKVSDKEEELASLDGNGRLLVAVAVGAGSDLEKRVEALNDQGVDLIVVDSGHGHSDYIMDAVRVTKDIYPKTALMAGNVATYDGARALIDAGVDILRVGVGPGSICTTRIISGMGVPQLTAVAEAVRASTDTDVSVIADGGIKQIGDMAKALAMGAHGVMLGSLLASRKEAPGEIVKVGETKYKKYRGMGSLSAMVKGGAERYGQDPKELREKLIPEGVEGILEYKGTVADYLFQIAGSLKSSLYYLGASSLSEFREVAQFVKITSASRKESDIHSISVTDVGNNYNK